jgi:hypothetical protein
MEIVTEHKGKKNTISNFSCKAKSLQSLSKKAGHDGNNNADNYHGCDGEVNFQVGPVNDNITRQTPNGEFPEPWPEKPHCQKYYT